MGPGPKGQSAQRAYRPRAQGQSAQRAPWDPQGRPPWDPTGPKNAFLGPLGPKKLICLLSIMFCYWFICVFIAFLIKNSKTYAFLKICKKLEKMSTFDDDDDGDDDTMLQT